MMVNQNWKRRLKNDSLAPSMEGGAKRMTSSWAAPIWIQKARPPSTVLVLLGGEKTPSWSGQVTGFLDGR